MNTALCDAIIALQVFQVAFLWVHDWVPLGRLNDVKAVRAIDSRRRLIAVALIQSVPYTLGLIFTLHYARSHFPGWLWTWLFVSYGLLFLGQLRAWWIPYLLRPDPERAERYRIMFGNTHAFLPVRNGVVPNTLHVMLHAATLATIILLIACG